MVTSSIRQYETQDSFAKLFTVAEYAFCFIALLYFTGAYSSITSYFLGRSIAISLESLLRYLVIPFSFGLIIFRWQLSFVVIRRAVLMWLLLGWTILSYFWSAVPEITYLSMRGLLLPAILFALYFSSRFNLKDQIKILTIFFFLVSFLSLIVVFAVPAVGRHPMSAFDGAWRGLFGHKNRFSRYMLVTLILLLSSFLGKESNKVIPQRVALAGAIFIQLMILASTSKTGLFLSIVLFSFLFWLRGYRWHGLRSILKLTLSAIVTATVVVLVTSNWNALLLGIGRDPTLTGRTLIWSEAISAWFDRFWIGYGLDAFWDVSLPFGQQIGMAVTGVRRLGYVVPNSHNGYIDTVLALGFVGLVLFLLTLLSSFNRAFRSAYIFPGTNFLFASSFLVFYTIQNFTESVVLNVVDFQFMMYCSVYFSLLLPEREFDSLDQPLENETI